MVVTVIYIDVLIFLNAVIDYFLILAASTIASVKIKEIRLVFSSVFASFTSLYIFAPHISALFDLLIQVSICLVVSLVAFGFKSIVHFLKTFSSVMAVTFIYNGLAITFFNIFKPSAMVIKNNVVYFNISALEMIAFSCIGYFIIRLGRFLVCRFSPHSKRIEISIINNNSVVDTKALVDSGNSLKDIYNGRNVVITDKNTAIEIFGEINTKPPLLLPYESIGGKGMIKSYYCEAVKLNGRKIDKVLVAVSENAFVGDYRAIVSPDILEG